MSRRSLFRFAIALLILTIAYNTIEGVIAIGAGLKAGSLVLIAFGAASYLEVAAAAAVLWRLSFRDDEAGERAEASVLRFIGASFEGTRPCCCRACAFDVRSCRVVCCEPVCC